MFDPRQVLVAVALIVMAVPTSAQFLVARTGSDIVTIDMISGDTIDRFPIDLFGSGARGLEWSGTSYYVSDAINGDIWESNETFDDASIIFSLPMGNTAAGVARIGSTLFVNSQSGVPPDTLFALDSTSGTVIDRHPIPIDITGLADLAGVGGSLYGVNVNTQELWRIDTISGDFVESFALPAQTFAIASDEAEGVILYVSNSDFTVYALNPTTGASVPRASLTGTDFILTAVFRAGAVPVEPMTWGEIKRRFDSPN